MIKLFFYPSLILRFFLLDSVLSFKHISCSSPGVLSNKQNKMFDGENLDDPNSQVLTAFVKNTRVGLWLL